MRPVVLLIFLALSPAAFAQSGATASSPPNPATPNPALPNPTQIAGAVITARQISAAPVLGAPYSATITNEMIQTLADGNRIVQSSSGMLARDSQGRTRQDAPLPAIGGLTPANAPHLVFIQDPVAQVSYTLNLTAKTAQKISMAATGSPAAIPGQATVAGGAGIAASGPGGPGPANTFFLQVRDGQETPPLPPLLPPVMIQKTDGPETTEDLGSQTMEGVFVTGTRTTRTIPAGQIGNDRPIGIVTEVWTSPDLKTIVYSKRSDPRIGEQTFQLTNISRSEPDPSLFTVPSDFKTSDGPEPMILYRRKE